MDRYFDIGWRDYVTDLRCVRCHRVVIDPYASSCKHTFCDNCSQFYDHRKEESNCPQCQEHTPRPDELDYDVELRTRYLRIFCPNRKYGYNYAHRLEKIPKHLMTRMDNEEAALPVEPPETNAMDEVVNRPNMNATIGELKDAIREMTDKINQLETKIYDIENKINASTGEGSKVKGRKGAVGCCQQ